MEYGYALITPKGNKDDIGLDFIKELMKEGIDHQLSSLIYIYDVDDDDIQLFLNNTQDVLLCEQMKKNGIIIPIFVYGNNTCKVLKDIAIQYNNYQTHFHCSKKNRYMDRVYVSYDENEAIEDFCEYMQVDDFDRIKDKLFAQNTNGLYSYDFRALKDYCKSKLK